MRTFLGLLVAAFPIFFIPNLLHPILFAISPKIANTQTGFIVALFPVIFLTSLSASALFSKSVIRNSKFLIQTLKIFLISYSIYLFFLTLARYYNFRSEIIDLSYYDQVLYQLSHFIVPKVWDTGWFVWGDHFDGILLLFTPLYWLKRDPAILMAIQAGLAISATIPIYLLVKQKFNDQKNSTLFALSISASYLLFGPHQMGYLYGFHEIVMFPFFFFWMIYFLEKESYKKFLLFLFLTTILKEETAFYLIFLGLYFSFKNLDMHRFLNSKKIDLKAQKIPLLFIITGVVWYILTFKIIFPHFPPNWDVHWGLYGELANGKGFFGIVETLLTNPLKFFSTLVNPPSKIGTITVSLGAFGLLPLLWPPSLIVTIPAWLQKLLTNDIASLTGFHYSSALTALTIFALIESLHHFIKRFKNPTNSIITSSLFLLFISLYSNFFYGYKPSSLFTLTTSIQEFKPTPGQDTAYKLMKEIPKEASVSASYILTPHLLKPTGKVLAIPHNNEQSDYILINHNIGIPLTTLDYYQSYLKSLEANYDQLKSENNVFLLKRKGL